MFLNLWKYSVLILSLVALNACVVEDITPPESPPKSLWSKDGQSELPDPSDTLDEGVYFDINYSEHKNTFVGIYSNDLCTLQVEGEDRGIRIDGQECSDISGTIINSLDINPPSNGKIVITIEQSLSSRLNSSTGFYGFVMFDNYQGEYYVMEFRDDDYINFFNNSYVEQIYMSWGNESVQLVLDYELNEIRIRDSKNNEVYSTGTIPRSINTVYIGAGDPADWSITEFTVYHQNGN